MSKKIIVAMVAMAFSAGEAALFWYLGKKYGENKAKNDIYSDLADTLRISADERASKKDNAAYQIDPENLPISSTSENDNLDPGYVYAGNDPASFTTDREELRKAKEQILKLNTENEDLRNYMKITKNAGYQVIDFESGEYSPRIIDDEGDRYQLESTDDIDYVDVHVYTKDIFMKENGDYIKDPNSIFGSTNLIKFFDEVKEHDDADMLIYAPIDEILYELVWDGDPDALTE